MTDDSRVDADADPTADSGGGDSDGDGDGDDSEWRFALDEVGPEAERAKEAARSPPIEPESVDTEHALFVVAGVLGTLLLVFSVTL